MASELKYHSFYHKDWALSESIKAMTLEQVAVYWTLLVHQMNSGSIPADFTEIANLIGRGMTAERLQTEIWPALVEAKTGDPFFVEVPNVPEGRPKRLHNPKLSETMDNDLAYFSGRRKGGQVRAVQAATERLTNTKLSKDMVKLVDPTPTFNWAEFRSAYPKRRDDASFESALLALQHVVTDQEEFDDLMTEVRKYRRSLKDREFALKLENWAREWRIAYGVRQRNKEESPQPTTSTTVNPPKPQRDLREAPWIPGRYDTDEIKAKLAAFYNEERKQRWMNGDPTIKEEWDQFQTQGSN